MAKPTIPIRLEIEVRDDLSFLRRELSSRYNRDYSISDVIRALMHGYAGNPRLAEYLRVIMDRRPSIQNPFGIEGTPGENTEQ